MFNFNFFPSIKLQSLQLPFFYHKEIISIVAFFYDIFSCFELDALYSISNFRSFILVHIF